MDEKKEVRTNIEDLPQPEQELTPDEAKDVQGGLLLPAVQAAREAARSSNQDSSSNNLVQGNRIGTD